MNQFPLVLVLFVLWSGPKEFSAETEPQGSDAGKSAAAASKNLGEQKKTGKDAAVQPQGKKKKVAKKDEDCGCETTLFGEPVPQPVRKPAQGKANTNAGKQTAKPKVKNVDTSKTATKSDLKEGTIQNSEKQPAQPSDQ